ncbi:MAG: helix-turn-helix transcriptional regulator [Oscillospiraceae bacterium]|nr:helix-turn-helix transcriptional regulator [Oscillospiraceae bacterium]
MSEHEPCGYFKLELDAYLKQHHISKYRLRQDANLQPTQLQTYCRGEVQRIDLAVMARICHALNCELWDILHYIKPEA